MYGVRAPQMNFSPEAPNNIIGTCPGPLVLMPYTYMNKTLKIVIKFKRLAQIIKRTTDQTAE